MKIPLKTHPNFAYPTKLLEGNLEHQIIPLSLSHKFSIEQFNISSHTNIIQHLSEHLPAQSQ